MAFDRRNILLILPRDFTEPVESWGLSLPPSEGEGMTGVTSILGSFGFPTLSGSLWWRSEETLSCALPSSSSSTTSTEKG